MKLILSCCVLSSRVLGIKYISELHVNAECIFLKNQIFHKSRSVQGPDSYDEVPKLHQAIKLYEPLNKQIKLNHKSHWDLALTIQCEICLRI